MYNELFKKVNTIKTIDASDLVKKADYDQKIDESEKILIINMINILLLKNLISQPQKTLKQDKNK